MSEVVRATYYIETPANLDAAASAIAGEQSTGTFTRVPLESDELVQKYSARISHLHLEGERKSPALPGKYSARRFQAGRIVIDYPIANIGVNLASLFTTVCGNLFELNEVSAIRLEKLELPDAFYKHYHGPKFGIAGTREIAGVNARPLIGTIIKPNVGLSAQQTADLSYSLAVAGVDFIKDDELLVDPTYASFEERVDLVTVALGRAAQKTGRKAMYAFNLSGDLDHMRRRHDYVVSKGGDCIMLNVHMVGLSATHAITQHAQVPVHGHRAGWGMFTRHPALGMTTTAMQTLCHLAGVDHYHTSGLHNKFWEPDDEVVTSIRACLSAPEGTNAMMPVLSSGQVATVIPETFARTGSCDLIHLAGGGILAHPDGPEAGVKSMRAAWEAALHGVSLEHASRTNSALKRALSHFGRRE